MLIMNKLILGAAVAAALTFASVSAVAAPSVLATVDKQGGISLEFVADAANPVSAFDIKIPLNAAAAKASVPEECLKAPRGFTALCNVHEGMFKAVVYTTNPDRALPSGSLGYIKLPAGAVSLAKSGEVQGVIVGAYNGHSMAVTAEVLTTSGLEPSRESLQTR
jgi:hypothetical protein